MIPLLLVTNDEKKAQKYIESLQKKLGILDSFVLSVRKEGTQLKIDMIREIASQVIRLGSASLMVCIYDFETAKSDSQNTLLKTLEESGQSTQFILVTSDVTGVLPTILSRVQIVQLENKTRKGVPVEFNGGYGRLLVKYDGMQKKPDKAVAFCEDVLFYVRTTLHEQALANKPINKITHLITEILSTRLLIAKNNISPQLGTDHLLLLLHRYYANS